MADSVISLEKVKAFWHSQVHEEEKWNLNKVSLFPYFIFCFIFALFLYDSVFVLPSSVVVEAIIVIILMMNKLKCFIAFTCQLKLSLLLYLGLKRFGLRLERIFLQM